MMPSNAKRKMWLFVLVLGFIFLTNCTSQLDQQINDCRDAFPSYVESMSEIQEEWEDTFEVALSTSRISLAGPVGDLQDIRREAEKVISPVCMVDSHEGYVEGMETYIDFFLDFMADADAEPDEFEISLAELKMSIIPATIEQYEGDPEAFFEETSPAAPTTMNENLACPRGC